MTFKKCDRCGKEFDFSLKMCTLTLSAYDSKCNKLDWCKACQKEIREFAKNVVHVDTETNNTKKTSKKSEE